MTPRGYGDVDPRTARRVPLTLPLREGLPVYPGDPQVRFDPSYTDTRGEEGGYLVERVTSLGTHTGTHLCAPAHLQPGGATVADLDERLALMPLVVVDLRERIRVRGPRFRVKPRDLRAWEREFGQVPPGACLLLLTGYATLADVGEGERSPYVTTPAPGLGASAVDWLYDQRDVLAVGADTLGPDATSDHELGATTAALRHGGFVLCGVGPGLADMRPHGDWVAVNGARPRLGGFPVGVTGFTLP